MKKKIIATLILVLAIVGIFYIVDRMKYTSFKEVILNTVNKDDVARIVIDRHPDNAKVSIENKVIVKKILDDFERMELKKENVSMRIGDYAIRIYSNNKDGFGLEFFKDNAYVRINNGMKTDIYKIVNSIDPVKIIEDKNLDWYFPDK
ncbi:hypothetical protein [Brevibacillus laterosporus]|uniref:hypothetical protein n=1 Tax=Brevibacillus laterosporus TaxID=1465 RepID=UPI000839B52A|nr:hypothetical protein [Brevibacillus laterosporus]